MKLSDLNASHLGQVITVRHEQDGDSVIVGVLRAFEHTKPLEARNDRPRTDTKLTIVAFGQVLVIEPQPGNPITVEV